MTTQQELIIQNGNYFLSKTLSSQIPFAASAGGNYFLYDGDNIAFMNDGALLHSFQFSPYAPVAGVNVAGVLGTLLDTALTASEISGNNLGAPLRFMSSAAMSRHLSSRSSSSLSSSRRSRTRSSFHRQNRSP